MLIADDHAPSRERTYNERWKVTIDSALCFRADAAEAIQAAVRSYRISVCSTSGCRAAASPPPGDRRQAAQREIVMLTVSDDDDDLFAALRAGADGYLL